VFSCASHLRPEHGTVSTSPDASPFTTSYYKNLRLDDMVDVMAWEYRFFPFCFEYAGAYDMYFYGIKKI
jgi:hypothetical protein